MSRLLDEFVEVKRVLRLAWPVMVSGVSLSLMHAADAIFVGRLGTAQLAAIGLSVTTVFLFLGLPIGLVRGLRVATAQATGAERSHSMERFGWQAIWLGLGLGVLVGLASFAGPTVFRLLGASAEVQVEALAYFRVRILAAPLALSVLGLTAWFEGRGDTRTPMRANVLANVLSVVLDAILVNGAGPVPAFGIRGAAWAGVVSIALAALLLLRAALPTLRATPWRPHRALLAESFRLGLPIGVQRLLDIVSWTILTGVLAAMGDIQLAAHVVAIRILMLSFLPGFAIAEATAVLVGQAVGARQPERAHRAWRAGVVAAVGVMALGGLGFVVAPELLLRAFSASPEVFPIARKLLWIAAAFQIIDAAATVTYFALDGAGDTRFTLISSLGLSWGVKLPLGVVLASMAGLGAVGAWLGLTGELVILLFVLGWRWRSRRWYPAAVVAVA